IAALARASEPVHVRLIGINDFHGNLESSNLTLFLKEPGAPPDARGLRVNVGGAAAMAGLIEKLREGAPHSVTLAAGDLIGAAPLDSTLFRHESTIEILNDAGLELSSVGNHEFDAGVNELRRIMRGGCAPPLPDSPVTSCADSPYRGARFKYLAANVLDAKGHAMLAPSIVKRFEGVPIGFIGAVTRATPQMVVPSGVKGLRFLDEAQAVNRAARALEAQGVKAIVAIFHEGFELGTPLERGDWNDVTCPEAHGPLLDIAHRLDPAIKVVFSGHTHQGYRCEIDGRLLIQGTSFGRGISVVDIELDRATREMRPLVRSLNLPVLNERTDPAQKEKLVEATPEPFAAALRDAKPDPKIARKVAHYAEMVAPKANRAIGRIGGTFSRVSESGSDSTAGRMIADAQLAATRGEGAQIAFMNSGGIRTNLECATPPCTVTFGDAFTMQPFGNSLVTMTLTGEQLKSLLESQHRRSGEPLFLQPSQGFTYTWQSDAPRGEHVRGMRLEGEPIEAAKRYRVTVNSFLAEGGDQFAILEKGSDRKGGGPDVDALIAYLGSAVRSPISEPRITRLP
ncbi:MAG: bifunctional metallophosphatase/5'-nucleotidase, partial [Bacillota bacterium]